MMEKRGMKQADLRKRGAKLAELRARLVAAPRAPKPRATIKAPEPYVLDIGTLYACPVKSSNINPRGGKKNFDGSPWTPEGGGNSSFSIAGAHSIISLGISRWSARSRFAKSRVSPTPATTSGRSSTPLTRVHAVISTSLGSRRSARCRSTWTRRAPASGNTAGHRLSRLERPRQRGERHHDLRNDVPVEP